MGKRTQITIGIIVLVWGLLLLLGRLLQIDIGVYLWPLLLIAIGVWLLLRPGGLARGGPTQVVLLGDIRRRGSWKVQQQDIWCLIGDVNLDFTDAEVPIGETLIKVQGFVGSVRVTVPEGVALSISSTAFVTDARVFGYKQDYIFTVYDTATEGYAEAERKIRLELLYFVTDLRVRHSADYQA
mgnify:CR=1 FL=1